MNFAELVSEVTSLTKRPDLEPRIEAAVKAATLKAHHSSFYSNDLRENSLQFDTPAYIQSFDPYTVIPRFRKAKYIRNWYMDGQGSGPGHFYKNIQIENALDAYGFHKTDVFYMAGKLLQMRSKLPINIVLFGYYIHPNVTEDNYESWIAVEYPYAIVYEAARNIFASIGHLEQARIYQELTSEQYRELTISSVETVPE